jgi:hypothetical protein
MILVLAIVALLAVSGPSATAAPSGAPGPACDRIIQVGGPVSWRPERVVLGVVAVPPPYIPQTVEVGGRWPYWSKSGLVVRADSPPVVVSVPSRWRDRVAISWGNSRIVPALVFGSCPPASGLGDWNAYAGGFYLRSRAACVPLTFRLGSRTATVRFGVGKRCR